MINLRKVAIYDLLDNHIFLLLTIASYANLYVISTSKFYLKIINMCFVQAFLSFLFILVQF